MNSETLLPYDLANPQVKAFSTTRISPFSCSATELRDMGAYAAFNVTDYCHDKPSRVQRNREWLAQTLGIDNVRLVMPHQTHSDRVMEVDDSLLALSTADRAQALEGVDALITRQQGVCIGVSTADCVPILLYDPAQKACAAIHAGWRGTVSHIATKAIRLMQATYGTRPSDLRAIIGPSISLQAFEVGDEVVEAFAQAGFDISRICRKMPPMHPDDINSCTRQALRPHIDLWAANAMLMEEQGISLEHIQVCGICTYQSHDTFFSARQSGIRSGRIFTGIMMERQTS